MSLPSPLCTLSPRRIHCARPRSTHLFYHPFGLPAATYGTYLLPSLRLTCCYYLYLWQLRLSIPSAYLAATTSTYGTLWHGLSFLLLLLLPLFTARLSIPSAYLLLLPLLMARLSIPSAYQLLLTLLMACLSIPSAHLLLLPLIMTRLSIPSAHLQLLLLLMAHFNTLPLTCCYCLYLEYILASFLFMCCYCIYSGHISVGIPSAYLLLLPLFMPAANGSI